MEEKLKEAGAGEVILRAMKTSSLITSAGENAILTALQVVVRLYNALNFERAVSSNANVASTLSFAIANLSKSAKDLGLVGFPKELADAGKSGNGHWNPQMLQSINVTIGKLKGEETPAVNVSIPANPDSTPEPTAPSVS